jgi:YidC/Oxa1 family membrane protein insertase
MNEQKRFFLFLMVSFLTMFALQIGLEQAGFFPKPDEQAKAKAAALAKAQADPLKKTDAEKAAETAKKADDKPAEAVVAAAPANVFPEESIDLGSADPASGFAMHLRLNSKGAGLMLAESSRFAADHLPGQNVSDKMLFVQRQVGAADSLTLEIRQVDGEEKAVDLSEVNWEVVRTAADAPAVVSEGDTQKVAFRHKPPEVPGLTITKSYALAKGRNDIDFAVTLESDTDRSVSYRLVGPHGLPLEGQWYSYTFRDLFYAPLDPRAALISRSATNVATSADPNSGYPPELVTTPIRFAGVETQYFAAFLAMKGASETTPEGVWVSEATEMLVGPIPTDPNKSDITVALTTQPARVGPSTKSTHEYSVFLGPKTKEALAPFGAEELTTYRRGWAVPGSRLLARSFISPLLDGTYDATRRFFGIFGASRGSYGLAIILLTVVVRLMIFPLSRKQAITAKRMQELQPQMQAIKEKFKDDKERQGRETMELYKKAGVNPFSGCLIAMIQLPVFMGLWQTLNNSVALRQAPFLYIDNLAAPDALFRFPGTVPFLGDYFNLLPIVSVVLMWLQMKLFSPPPANEEAELQQKMFSVMMVFMSFMFYKVPSGLGLYFITSSLWAVCERLLLPKLVHDLPAPEMALEAPESTPGSAKSNARKPQESDEKPVTGWRAKWQQLLNEAEKQRTIQNETRKKQSGGNAGSGRSKPKKGRR